MSENEVLVGRLVADRYRVVRRLGSGGMGTVYVAIQEPLGREVALKVVRRDLSGDSRTLERFRREAMSLSQAHHPHIVTLHDFGELPSGAMWFAMELVKGENLRQRLVRTGPLPVKKTLALARDSASALAAAHALGIIHRDLKPENILLMEAAGTPDFVKIVDFGVAKLTTTDDEAEKQEQLTARGSVVGTPGYIAPEVSLRGVTTDARSDLYSLGVVWFEALTGRAPFRAPTPTALMMAHALDPIPSMPDDVPLAIAGLVQRLLAKAPEDRPESAEELVALIDSLPGFDSNASLPRPSPALVEAGAPTINDSGERATQPHRPRRPQDAAPVLDDDVASAPTEVPVGAPTLEPTPPRRVRAVAGALLAGAVATAAVVVPIVIARDKPVAAADAGVFTLDPWEIPDAGPAVVVDAGTASAAALPDAGSLGPPPVDAGAAAPDAGPRKKKRVKRPDGTAEDPQHDPDIYSD